MHQRPQNPALETEIEVEENPQVQQKPSPAIDPEIEVKEPTPPIQQKPPPAIDPEPMPLVDGEEHVVDPASIIVQRIGRMIVTLGIGGASLFGLVLAMVLGGLPFWLFLLLLVPFVGFALLQWQWPVLHYHHLRYRVDSKGVQIRRGVIWRQVISIPSTRVQHTDVTQGPFERHWDLATLTVHTAGTFEASISLSGLNHAVALHLRDHLLPSESHGS